MPKSGFASVTIRDAVYELARGKAEKQGMKVAEFTERAIRSYVVTRDSMEDKAKLVAEILSQLEEKRADQANSTRQLTLLADRAAGRG
jgi:hypothetical protein